MMIAPLDAKFALAELEFHYGALSVARREGIWWAGADEINYAASGQRHLSGGISNFRIPFDVVQVCSKILELFSVHLFMK